MIKELYKNITLKECLIRQVNALDTVKLDNNLEILSQKLAVVLKLPTMYTGIAVTLTKYLSDVNNIILLLEYAPNLALLLDDYKLNSLTIPDIIYDDMKRVFKRPKIIQYKLLSVILTLLNQRLNIEKLDDYDTITIMRDIYKNVDIFDNDPLFEILTILQYLLNDGSEHANSTDTSAE